MSVIQVRQAQPNWWEQLAANVVVPMISNAIERQRQRDENRKQNAWLSEVLKMAGGTNSGTADLLPPLSSTSGGNGWESAFHNTDNSLGSFGEAVGLTPQMTATLPQATQQPTVTRDQLIQKGLELLGTKRFGGLNSADALKLLAPYMDAAEATRMETKRGNAATNFRKANDAIGGLNSIIEATIRGDLPESFANIGQNYYSSTRPQPFTQDTGGGLVQGSYDPITNTFSTQNTIEKTLSPEAIEARQRFYDNLKYMRDKDKAERELRQYEFDTNAGIEEKRITNTQTNADRDYELRRIQTMSDIQFKEYQMKETQKAAQAGAWNAQKDAELKAYNAHLEQVYKDIERYETAYNNAQSEEEREAARVILDGEKGEDGKRNGGLRLQADILRSKIYSMFNPPQPKRYDSSISSIISNANAGQITGHYGEKRKDGHIHNGIDLPANEGEPVKVLDRMGADLKVSRVETDPNNPSNYGCAVWLDGTRGGKSVRVLLAHMKEGSIKVKKDDIVKAGDIVGKVGSTGRSSGNHLHVEVWVDGNRVNPEEFFSEAEPTQPTTTEAKQSNGQAQQDNGQTVESITGANTSQSRDVNYANLPPYLTGNTSQTTGKSYYAANPTTQPNTVQVAQTANSPQPQPTTAQKGSGLTGVHALEVGDSADLPQPISGDVQPATAQQTPTPSAATSWNPFAATPAYADEAPIDALSSASPDDGGLTQYRADGDTSPVTWRNASGSPMLTSNGQLFTQRIYDDWATQADAGKFRDVGINNRADLDKWLGSVGMSPHRPAEQRGLNNLNGKSNANLPPEGVDDGLMPFDSRPSTSPEKYPAPTFTDELNGTTPADTQDLLDGLNGIVDSRYRNWTRALRQYYPSAAYTPDINVPVSPAMPEARPTPTGTPSSGGAVPTQAQGSGAAPQQTAPAPRRAAPQPKRGYTNYEEQRNAVDTAAKDNGIDSSLIRAIIQVESGWKPTARSKAGAMGLMQLMPATARELGVRNAYDPAQNIAGGSKYIARLIRRYGGDVSKALMAYNCGPGNVAKGRIPQASRQYAQKVMSIYNRLKG